jgi:hypothetical protein
MATAAKITSGLQVKLNNQQYQSQPPGFNADIPGTSGPTPGTIQALTTLSIVDLSQITRVGNVPGLCFIKNLDQINTVQAGPYDPDTTTFLPLLDFLPGEGFTMRLSAFLGKELVPGTGTGIEDVGNVQLAIKALGAPCQVQVDVFGATAPP